MDINQEKRDSVRFLTSLEEGSLPIQDCFDLAEELDSTIVSLVIRYLRKKYPSTNPQSMGVMNRLLELTSNYPVMVQKIKEGDLDPIREWFEETYDYREFFQQPEEFINIVVNKIEG